MTSEPSGTILAPRWRDAEQPRHRHLDRGSGHHRLRRRHDQQPGRGHLQRPGRRGFIWDTSQPGPHRSSTTRARSSARAMRVRRTSRSRSTTPARSMCRPARSTWAPAARSQYQHRLIHRRAPGRPCISTGEDLTASSSIAGDTVSSGGLTDAGSYQAVSGTGATVSPSPARFSAWATRSTSMARSTSAPAGGPVTLTTGTLTVHDGGTLTGVDSFVGNGLFTWAMAAQRSAVLHDRRLWRDGDLPSGYLPPPQWRDTEQPRHRHLDRGPGHLSAPTAPRSTTWPGRPSTPRPTRSLSGTPRSPDRPVLTTLAVHPLGRRGDDGHPDHVQQHRQRQCAGWDAWPGSGLEGTANSGTCGFPRGRPSIQGCTPRPAARRVLNGGTLASGPSSSTAEPSLVPGRSTAMSPTAARSALAAPAPRARSPSTATTPRRRPGH